MGEGCRGGRVYGWYGTSGGIVVGIGLVNGVDGGDGDAMGMGDCDGDWSDGVLC